MQIPSDILKAVALVAPKNDIRSYLNGVLIETAGRVVATDTLQARCAEIIGWRKDGTLWTQATEHETPRAAIDAAKGRA